jgi:hypothetical protein
MLKRGPAPAALLHSSSGSRIGYIGLIKRQPTSSQGHVCTRAAGNSAPTGDGDPVLQAKRTRLEALLSQEGTELSTSSSGRGVQVGSCKKGPFNTQATVLAAKP